MNCLLKSKQTVKLTRTTKHLFVGLPSCWKEQGNSRTQNRGLGILRRLKTSSQRWLGAWVSYINTSHQISNSGRLSSNLTFTVCPSHNDCHRVNLTRGPSYNGNHMWLDSIMCVLVDSRSLWHWSLFCLWWVLAILKIVEGLIVVCFLFFFLSLLSSKPV